MLKTKAFPDRMLPPVERHAVDQQDMTGPAQSYHLLVAHAPSNCTQSLLADVMQGRLHIERADDLADGGSHSLIRVKNTVSQFDWQSAEGRHL